MTITTETIRQRSMGAPPTLHDPVGYGSGAPLTPAFIVAGTVARRRGLHGSLWPRACENVLVACTESTRWDRL